MVADAINKSLSDMTQVLTTCSQAITNMQEMYTTSLVPQLDNVIDSMESDVEQCIRYSDKTR